MMHAMSPFLTFVLRYNSDYKVLLAVENRGKSRQRVSLDCGNSKNAVSQLPRGGGGGEMSVSLGLEPKSMALAFQILPIDETKPWNCVWKEFVND